MAANKKYLGMTVTQLGILGGLAGLALLLFCIVGWLVIRRGPRGPQAAPSTLMPPATATLMLPPTPTPTLASTPIPYETLIPSGWVQYQSSLFEIWLPAGYKAENVDNLVTGLGNSPIVALTLRGTYTSKSPNKIYVTVAYEPMTGESFDQFLNERLAQLGPVLSDRSRVDLNSVPAVRLIFTGRKGNNTDINELTYVILDGTTVWYVQYTAELTEFYNLLSTFEASAKTFRTAKP
jgi:hypothetical protein